VGLWKSRCSPVPAVDPPPPGSPRRPVPWQCGTGDRVRGRRAWAWAALANPDDRRPAGGVVRADAMRDRWIECAVVQVQRYYSVCVAWQMGKWANGRRQGDRRRRRRTWAAARIRGKWQARLLPIRTALRQYRRRRAHARPIMPSRRVNKSTIGISIPYRLPRAAIRKAPPRCSRRRPLACGNILWLGTFFFSKIKTLCAGHTGQ
jgi:hypothetical protein